MSVYTKRGDRGETDLFSGERVSKSAPRIESYGSVDELNSLIGVTLSHLKSEGDLHGNLRKIQNNLHVICANLANREPDPDRPEVKEGDVNWMEDQIDGLSEELPNLTKFILPGGSQPGSFLHYARSVCRRAERRVIEADRSEEISGNVIKYLNRLSDYLFVAARWINHQHESEEINPTYKM